jgi:hypothetical protein
MLRSQVNDMLIRARKGRKHVPDSFLNFRDSIVSLLALIGCLQYPSLAKRTGVSIALNTNERVVNHVVSAHKLYVRCTLLPHYRQLQQKSNDR